MRSQLFLVAFRVVTTSPGSMAHSRALTALAALIIGSREQHPTAEAMDEAVEAALTFPSRCGRCGEADNTKGSHGLGRC